MSAAVVTRRGRPPRARHDAGTEPLDWRRVVLVLVLVAGSAAAAVAAAGAMRQGPLAALGWIERERSVVSVDPSGDDLSLQLVVRLPRTACAERIDVDVLETTRSVELGVHSREPRFVVPPCSAPDRAAGQHPMTTARLSRPLTGRDVVVNGRQVPVGNL